jgi:alanine dehydrogenase
VLRGHLGPEHVSGVKEERILFWHRGLATTDLAVARLFLGRAAEAGLGTVLRYR